MPTEAAVSSAAVAMLTVELIFSMVLPVGLLIVWAVKTHAKLLPALVGIIAYALASVVLEELIHSLVLGTNTPIAAALFSNPIAYALYSGLVAGLLGELIRYLAFSTVLKNESGREPAVTFGIGYGGMECFVVLGISMVTNLFVAGTLNSMGVENFIREYAATERTEFLAAVEALNRVDVGNALLACLERVSMLAIQIELSVYVFAAARLDWLPLLPAAVAVHMVVEFCFALSQTGALPIPALEGVVAVIAVLLFFPVRRIYGALREAEAPRLDRFGRRLS